MYIVYLFINAITIFSFTSLGIQCVKKRDIEKSLKVREAHKLDPFGSMYYILSHVQVT